MCVVAGFYTIGMFAYHFTATADPGGSRDFHQFWYAGNFLRQGSDPYAAYFNHEQPKLPVHYLDGVTIAQHPVAQPDLEIIPSNTPLMLLLLTPFALFSWQTAKWAFLTVNLILMLVTGWLVLRRVPFGGIRLSSLDERLLFLLYVDFSATRIAVENGQTTLLVFLLMLLAIVWADRSSLLTGLALGVALSKYSVSLPVFLFLLYKKKYSALLVAIFVQALGLLGLAAVSRTSPGSVVQENIELFLQLFDQPGVHLGRFFELFTSNHVLAQIPVLSMTVLVFLPLFGWLRKSRNISLATQDMINFHLLTILSIWTMLVAYHRLYDTLILILFPALVFKGLAYPNLWKLSHKENILLRIFLAVVPLILILPARLVDKIVPGYYGNTSDAVTTVLIIFMLVISMFLLHRFLQTIRQRTEAYDLSNDPHRDSQPSWINHP